MKPIRCHISSVAILLVVMLSAGCGGSSNDTVDEASSAQSPEQAGPSGTPETQPQRPNDSPMVGPGNGEQEDEDTLLAYMGSIGVEQQKREDSLFNGQPRPGAMSGARAFSSLKRMGEPFTLREYNEAVLEAQDTCTRYDSNGAVEGQLADIDVGPLEFLEGGEVITIGSQQGSYTELLLQQVGGFPAYNNSGEDFTLPLPVPEGLVADIPGSEFPAVSGIGFPSIEPLVLLGETTDNLLNLTFRWDVGSEPATRVLLGVNTISANGSYNGFICEAIDDGEFTAPDWAASGLDGSASTKGRTAVRHAEELTVSDDTLVVGSNLSLFSSAAF